MLILHEGELLHTDSSTEILEHHGVKGMKWGKRLRSATTKLYDDHKENLRYKYRKSGLNEEQVEQKLQKRLKNEKRAALAVGAAVATYGAYKGAKFLKDEFGTQTFKKGDKINSVMGNDIDYGRHFYAYDNKKDGLKYENLRLKDLNRVGHQGYRVTTKFTDDAKIASNRAAKKEFKRLMKTDKEFRDSVKAKAKRSLRIKSQYGSFNTHMPYADENQWNKFTDTMRKKGYSGIKDINDRKYSDYDSKNPIILFDEKKMKQVGKKAIKVNSGEYNRQVGKMVVKGYIKENASLIGGVAAYKSYKNHAKNTARRKKDKTYTEKYSGK